MIQHASTNDCWTDLMDSTRLMGADLVVEIDSSWRGGSCFESHDFAVQFSEWFGEKCIMNEQMKELMMLALARKKDNIVFARYKRLTM